MGTLSCRSEKQDVAGCVIEYEPGDVADRSGAEVWPSRPALPGVDGDQPAAEARRTRDDDLLGVTTLLVHVHVKPRPLSLESSLLKRGGCSGLFRLVDAPLVLWWGRGGRVAGEVWRRWMGRVVPGPVQEVLQGVTRANVDDVKQMQIVPRPHDLEYPTDELAASAGPHGAQDVHLAPPAKHVRTGSPA